MAVVLAAARSSYAVGGNPLSTLTEREVIVETYGWLDGIIGIIGIVGRVAVLAAGTGVLYVRERNGIQQMRFSSDCPF